MLGFFGPFLLIYCVFPVYSVLPCLLLCHFLLYFIVCCFLVFYLPPVFVFFHHYNALIASTYYRFTLLYMVPFCVSLCQSFLFGFFNDFYNFYIS